MLQIVKAWNNCQDCDLHKTKCNYVFYKGSVPCDVLFIGEAPGNDEDLSGIPFVGKAGRVLDEIISTIREQGIKFTYGMTNIISCIPQTEGKIRTLTKVEADACKFRLLTTIQTASPKLLVVLGTTAKKYLKIPARAMPKEAALPILELPRPDKILAKGGTDSLEYKRTLLYLREAIEQL